MSVDEPNVIDITAFDKESRETLLVIADHLPWLIADPDPLYTKVDHLRMLQAKVYRYVDFIDSGELLQTFPQSAGTAPVILIKFLFPLNRNATNLVNNLKQHLAPMGVDVRWDVNDPRGTSPSSPKMN